MTAKTPLAHFTHGKTIEDFRQALIVSLNCQKPLDHAACIRLWEMLKSCFEEMEKHTAAADVRISRLQCELDLFGDHIIQNTPSIGNS